MSTPLRNKVLLVTLRCKLKRGPGLALGPLGAPEYINLGSILGLGCLCQPFPAGVTHLGGGEVASRGPLDKDCPRTVHVDCPRGQFQTF